MAGVPKQCAVESTMIIFHHNAYDRNHHPKAVKKFFVPDTKCALLCNTKYSLEERKVSKQETAHVTVAHVTTVTTACGWSP